MEDSEQPKYQTQILTTHFSTHIHQNELPDFFSCLLLSCFFVCHNLVLSLLCLYAQMIDTQVVVSLCTDDRYSSLGAGQASASGNPQNSPVRKTLPHRYYEHQVQVWKWIPKSRESILQRRTTSMEFVRPTL
ncbi:hypothetical protein CFP56_011592 [Quercus suber]|uniref:Uncharacterized protein n=1 Tax=Quercus suber TaxID=58331 RepID=A0AAW0KXA8_QUESU